jgi:DNA (cytosine-5)-methyltransferase 1
MAAYYNEIEPYAAEWLRNLIKAGLIPHGEVDTRSIVDVAPDDLRAFTQCHFFAGIGGWGLALRLAGWSDDRPIWTGSCPCQPFSVAGKGAAQEDERHLWPVFFDLIRACRPPVVMGEQVAAAVGKSWLDGVSADLEGIGYATGAAIIPACAVDAPHRRDRLWFVADAQGGGRGQGIADTGGLREGDGAQGSAGRSAQYGDAWPVADANPTQRGPLNSPRRRVEGEHTILQGQEDPGRSLAGGKGDVANPDDHGRQAGRGDDQAARHGDPVAAAGGSDCSNVGDAHGSGRQQHGGAFAVEQKLEAAERGGGGAWANSIWLTGADGKARRVEPSICLLAHGVPGRVGRLRAYGNAIVPQVAAKVIMAFLDATDAA